MQHPREGLRVKELTARSADLDSIPGYTVGEENRLPPQGTHTHTYSNKYKMYERMLTTTLPLPQRQIKDLEEAGEVVQGLRAFAALPQALVQIPTSMWQ